jgi:hypothetical protein
MYSLDFFLSFGYRQYKLCSWTDVFVINKSFKNHNHLEKVYFTPNLWGLEHIIPQPMKMIFLPPELSKTRQITPETILENHKMKK